MASSAGTLNRVSRVVGPALLPAIAYGAYKGNVAALIRAFLTGPGRTSRIIALALLLLNWKSLPLAWTVRVLSTMVSHFMFRKPHKHTPDKLFHPVVSESHVSLLEVDYNVHKSNSTYFADLDVSRSHLVSHLFARGIRALTENTRTRLVADPSNPSQPAKGKFGVMLGSVHCSFKRELKPYQRYEMWSRVVGWDRKWLYIVTHFVERGAVRPGPRDDAGSLGGTRPQDWEKKIFATGMSKYVFKVGRLTVHPAVVIDASGMLPERPGGWVPAENGTGIEPTSSNGVVSSPAGSSSGTGWGWKRTEEEREKYRTFVEQFAALDGLQGQFNGGTNEALEKFALG